MMERQNVTNYVKRNNFHIIDRLSLALILALSFKKESKNKVINHNLNKPKENGTESKANATVVDQNIDRRKSKKYLSPT